MRMNMRGEERMDKSLIGEKVDVLLQEFNIDVENGDDISDYIDSLIFMQIILELEDSFNITVKDEELDYNIVLSKVTIIDFIIQKQLERG
ncbi:acyl carrier protein [Bacillus sp. RC55]